MKPRLKPIAWADMPLKARKCYLRLLQAFPHCDGLIRGIEHFQVLGTDQIFYRTREMRFFVSDGPWTLDDELTKQLQL